MRRNQPSGFTLTELLIVIAIIGILVAMLVPLLRNAWLTVHYTQCCTNLHRMWQVMGVREADETVNAKWSLRPVSWPGQLLPYVDHRSEIYLCPASDDWFSVSGSSSSGGGTSGTAGTSAADTPDVASAENPDEDYSDISELAEVKVVTGSGGVFYEPLREDYWVLRFSEQQYADAKSKGLLNNDDSANNIRDKYPCTYIPGANPNVYWLCFEDHGGDYDYKDVMIKVTKQSGGQYSLFVCSGMTGNKNSVISKPDGKELVYVGSNNNAGATITVSAQSGPGGTPPSGGGGSSGSSGTSGSTIIGPTLSTNYGMNDQFSLAANRGVGKIVMMDYCKYLMHPTIDQWNAPPFDPNQAGTPVFARHWGKINVLFADGSVSLQDPTDINPAAPSVEILLWLP